MAREPALERHIPELWPDLEHLFEVGETVGRLQLDPGWGAVRSVLYAEIDAINAQMESGTNVLPQADYALRHGRIGGLKAAVTTVDAIVNVAERRRKEQESRHEAGAETPAER